MSTTVDLGTKLEIITDYYGAGTIWDRMDISGLTADQINAMYNSLPGSSFTIDRTPSGLNLGRNYTNPFELPVVPGTGFDSNIPGGSYGGGNTFSGNVPANIITDPNTGLPVRQTAGALNGSGLSVATIADRISLGVMGVNIGAKLGMKIDDLLYQSDPDFWNRNLPTVNPATWGNIFGQSAIGQFFARVLFGIDGNNITGYISAEMLAYYYQLMRDSGFFSTGEVDFPTYQTSGTVTISSAVSPRDLYNEALNIYRSVQAAAGNTVVVEPSYTNDIESLLSSFSDNYISTASINLGTSGAAQGGIMLSIYNTIRVGDTITLGTSYTTRYIRSYYNIDTEHVTHLTSLGLRGTSETIFMGKNQDWRVLISSIGASLSPATSGVNPLDGATQYPPTNITGQNPQEIDQQLRQQYPDLYQDAITETTMQDDGTTSTTEYVPIPWVTDGLNPEQPVTGDGRGQTDTEVDPTTGQQILPTTPTDEQTQPPDTGEGSAPVPAVPTGSASSLWAVYNPSQGELNSFGAWLWSSDFVEQIKKLFADPMQAIIGVHKVFASPHTGGSQTIKCGYLDSGVSASVVTSQYTTVDCGSASLREYFGNVFDYDPFTKISIFLPFIGIVPLNTADVMRSTVSVKYKVDVITGACLAEVNISRDGGGGILYTYGGSAIVTYPVSSGSYVGAVQAALSTALGIGSAIATGGASLGASAGMVLGGLANAKTQVQHSGQFSGSSGAMGGKKPYLIVSRPQTRTPSKISEYKGIPSNAIHKLSSCSGFVKVQEVHLASKTAYDNEIQEIESLLKAGVII